MSSICTRLLAWPVAAYMVLAAIAPAAKAQVAPSATEVARYSGLHAAAHRGELAQVRKLLAGGALVDTRDPYGRTALHVATFARQREVIRALAQAGANLGLLENDRYDAVTIASVADDEPTLRLLLEMGASAKLTTSRYDGTALIAAAHLGHDGVVRQLIAAGAPLDHVNNLHWTAVIESIVLGDGGARHQAVLQALLEAGASARLTDREGNTPLALAQARGFKAMVEMLNKTGVKRSG
jgi:ankyrin repeat protein